MVYLTNISQFKKIGNLIKEFEEFENNFKIFEKPIKEFLDTVNDFFKDSSKQLYFERDSAELRFNILDKENKIVASRRDIKTLSSGEQQILILLTYLKFYSTEGKLFVIDEPELSLHPKWQDEFLDQIIKITPKKTQIIIATHSPAIVGKHENFCKVLLPYNE
jgi:predicted ATPase